MSIPFKTIKGRVKKVDLKPFRIKWSDDSASKAQTAVKQFLQPYWHRKIVCEEFIIPGGLLRMDFLNVTDKIAIEYQGEQHDDPNSHYFENPIDFLKSKRRDHDKEVWCEVNGYTFVEIYPDELSILSADWFKEKYDIDL